MPRPFGWTDKYCIDELMRRYAQLEDRLDAIEAEAEARKKTGTRSRKKPTAQGSMRAIGDKS